MTESSIKLVQKLRFEIVFMDLQNIFGLLKKWFVDPLFSYDLICKVFQILQIIRQRSEKIFCNLNFFFFLDLQNIFRLPIFGFRNVELFKLFGGNM